MTVTESVSDFILRDECRRLRALLERREAEIARLREDAKVSDRRIMSFIDTEAKTAAALTLAFDALLLVNIPRAEFWMNRALTEMGIDGSPDDLAEHYRPQREALAYRAQQEELEAAERFNAWRRQPIAAE